MASNPFEDENPFADPSVAAATSKTSNEAAKNGTAGFEDYNPFAEDNVAKPGPPPVTIPPPQPSEPAVIDIRSEPAQPPPYSAVAEEQENLAKRQEELERRAAELHEKEQQLKQMKYNERKNNFPPFPKFCPVTPCCFHDIGIDIPPDFQRTSRILFYSWQFYCLTLLLNVIVAMAYIIMSVGSGTVTFVVAIILFLLFVPCSFCFWYRPSYNAFKSDSSFSFMVFFFVLFFQILWNILACFGVDAVGTCGFVNGSKVYKDDSKVVGLMMIIMGIFFLINAILEIILLKKVHRVYRTTGASIQKAQAEFAQGAMSNKHVQNAAVAGARAAVQNQH